MCQLIRTCLMSIIPTPLTVQCTLKTKGETRLKPVAGSQHPMDLSYTI